MSSYIDALYFYVEKMVWPLGIIFVILIIEAIRMVYYEDEKRAILKKSKGFFILATLILAVFCFFFIIDGYMTKILRLLNVLLFAMPILPIVSGIIITSSIKKPNASHRIAKLCFLSAIFALGLPIFCIITEEWLYAYYFINQIFTGLSIEDYYDGIDPFFRSARWIYIPILSLIAMIMFILANKKAKSKQT